ADTKQSFFENKLVFDLTLVPHAGDDSWVEQTVIAAKKCLMGDSAGGGPAPDPDCDFCRYREAVKEAEQ
ncbi:hypothetical protein HZB08_01035, partial [Candidatus Saganbacteria bacterium]|nr:hypothetical protein [Candidatus Saganbacteria bacterium]